MKKRILIISFYLMIFFIAAADDIYLENGQIITGKVIDQNETEIVVETKYGELKVDKEKLENPLQQIRMKNGDFIIGNIISMENDLLKVKVQKSVLKIELNDVARIEYFPGYKNTNFEKQKFFSGREKLTKVYQSPTGNTLEEGEINISFVDYEFGITDNLQLSSNWIGYFEKDLNFSPKLKILDIRTQNIWHQLSIGGTYHSNYDGRYKQKSEWEGDSSTGYGYTELITTDNINSPMYGGFGSYTLEYKKNKGSMAISMGGAINNRDTIIGFGSFWTDITTKLIFMGKVERRYDLEEKALDNEEFSEYTDIGFIYSMTDKLRIGLHYQEPFIQIYYKLK